MEGCHGRQAGSLGVFGRQFSRIQTWILPDRRVLGFNLGEIPSTGEFGYMAKGSQIVGAK